MPLKEWFSSLPDVGTKNLMNAVRRVRLVYSQSCFGVATAERGLQSAHATCCAVAQDLSPTKAGLEVVHLNIAGPDGGGDGGESASTPSAIRQHKGFGDTFNTMEHCFGGPCPTSMAASLEAVLRLENETQPLSASALFRSVGGCTHRERLPARIQRGGDQVGALWRVWSAGVDPLLNNYEYLYAEAMEVPPLGTLVMPGPHVTTTEQMLVTDADIDKMAAHDPRLRGWTVAQRPGDWIYLPAGCPRQVVNLRSCANLAVEAVPAPSLGRIIERSRELAWCGEPDKLQTELVVLCAALRAAAQTEQPAAAGPAMS